jgi:hypothetical protein
MHHRDRAVGRRPEAALGVEERQHLVLALGEVAGGERRAGLEDEHVQARLRERRRRRRSARARADDDRLGAEPEVAVEVAAAVNGARGQAARGQVSAAGFEHYRNDEAGDAERTLSALGFVFVERRDVSPATSNQWLLRYRVTDRAGGEQAFAAVGWGRATECGPPYP